MNQEKEIQRLGFDAWAANIVVNALEDYSPIITAGDKGTLTTERKDHTIAIVWDGDDVTVTVRAYTIDNWRNFETTVKRSGLKRTTINIEYEWPLPKLIARGPTGRYKEV